MHPEQILIAIEELWKLTQNPNKPASEIIPIISEPAGLLTPRRVQ